MIFLTKRGKIVLLTATPIIIIPVASALNQYLTSLNFPAFENTYSNSSPSTIAKNEIDKDLKFNSPVTNAIFKEKEEQKPNQTQKIEDTKQPIIIKNPEKVEQKKPEIAAPQQAPTLKPKFAPQSATSGSNLIVGTELSRLTQLALQRKASGFSAEIKKLESRIANIDAQVKEINRYYDEEYNRNNGDDAPGSRRSWEEGRRLSLYSCEPSIDCPAIRLDQNKAELERLRREAANPKPLTAEEINLIKQGLLPDPDNPYAWGYDDEAKNPTLNRLKAENLSRVFNTPSYYSRVSSSISSLEYTGWTKSDVSNDFANIFKEHGVSSNSIQIYQYTPNEQNEDRANRSPIKAIVLNADDANAFDKFQKIMNQAIKQDNKIQAVVLKNVGSLNSLQNIDPILKAIPPSVIKLTLFLNNPAATRGLRGLENVKLKELELYSDSNAVSQHWSINPNALKNVDFISFDYQNQFNVTKNSGEKLPSSIIFNTLRFDKGDDVAKINEGLEIVFNSKINQRVFQGNFGGKGGWPTFLDFSDTNIKTLKGIWFDELNRVYNINVENWPEPFAKENFKGNRTLKFKRMIFQPDIVGGSDAYVVDISDFDGAQFSQRLAFGDPPPPPTEIQFKRNGQDIYGIPLYLKGQNLTGDAKSQLESFIRAANANGQRRITQIYVESDGLKSQLGGQIGNVLIQTKIANQNSQQGGDSDEIEV